MTIAQKNGSPLEGFTGKRILRIRPLFSRDTTFDDFEYEGYPKERHPEIHLLLRGRATIYNVSGQFGKTSKTAHEIQLRISFLRNDYDDSGVRLDIWPVEKKFVKSNFPLLKLSCGQLPPFPIRLDEAEQLLRYYATNENCEIPKRIMMGYNYALPQQRITNVVQILDDLFDASIKTIDLILVKGREWVRQIVEKTAPILNDTWKDGIFTSEKCNVLTHLLSKVIRNSKSNVADSPQKEEQKKVPRKKKDRYSQKEWEEIFALAFLFVRINPQLKIMK